MNSLYMYIIAAVCLLLQLIIWYLLTCFYKTIKHRGNWKLGIYVKTVKHVPDFAQSAEKAG